MCIIRDASGKEQEVSVANILPLRVDTWQLGEEPV